MTIHVTSGVTTYSNMLTCTTGAEFGSRTRIMEFGLSKAVIGSWNKSRSS